jgi:polyphosphate kinase 2 (PPK2 family)
MKRVNDWEENLINKDVEIIKFYFSLSKDQQERRMNARKYSQLKYWKLSKNDEKIVTKWDAFTLYKEQMFNKTGTEISPWVSINSNNKMIGRLTSLRYLLIKTDYENKKILKPAKYSETLSNYSATIEGVKFDNLSYEQFMIITKYSDDT